MPVAKYFADFSMLGVIVSYDERVLKPLYSICRMDPRSSSAHAGGDDARPSNMGGGDHDAVLRSVTQQAMAEMAKGLGEQNCTIEQFTHMRPPSFSGGANPLVAENWVQDIEDMLTVLSCTDEYKVLGDVEPLQGDLFQEVLPATIRSVKAVEFLHLTQGPMTVKQYVARFIKLSRFAPYLVLDEERKVRKFEEDLRQSLFEQVIGFRAQIFAKVVDKVAVIDGGLQRSATAQSRGKRPAPPNV
ncbi:uncharacterized protein LOC131151217 [Malania oleifera]|uniref:uncharacterized protein LOC131151217 n=1 Tax=Malania oleifera TaxID=397392 RepID=UPI0025ADC34C|nr:uncharacterized protein LOC131151217 [Malania oleifera]